MKRVDFNRFSDCCMFVLILFVNWEIWTFSFGVHGDKLLQLEVKINSRPRSCSMPVYEAYLQVEALKAKSLHLRTRRCAQITFDVFMQMHMNRWGRRAYTISVYPKWEPTMYLPSTSMQPMQNTHRLVSIKMPQYPQQYKADMAKNDNSNTMFS